MDGPGTYQAAVGHLTQATLKVLETAELGVSDIDLFVYHQANRRIISAVGDRLSLPTERVVDAISGLGNTSAASVPLALAAARDRGQLRRGMRVLIGAVGSGICWGAGILTW